MLLAKRDREEKAIRRFLEYYNQVNKASYEIKEWLDRVPGTRQGVQTPIPDCLCIDTIDGTKMLIERTMLTGDQDLKLYQGASEFLSDVRAQLGCKLPGVFLLHDWGVNAITFTTKNRGQKIAELCGMILEVAPTLAEGEEAQLCQPFPVKLRREEARSVMTNCALVWVLPEGAHRVNASQLDRQFSRVLEEANGKFTSYSDEQTVLLVNIWETGVNYEEFGELFVGIDMAKYPNIKHIYLSEGLPKPPIHHLWSKPQ
jgi:hypothetical protein